MLKGNKLSLNVAKTHAMLVSTRQKRSTLDGQNDYLTLTTRENDLRVVQKTKYLGVKLTAIWTGKSKSRQSLPRSPGQLAFKACQIIPAKRILGDSLHRYRVASFSVLLFCLGLRRLNRNESAVNTAETCRKNCRCLHAEKHSFTSSCALAESIGDYSKWRPGPWPGEPGGQGPVLAKFDSVPSSL